jgi:hypothetical protein
MKTLARFVPATLAATLLAGLAVAQGSEPPDDGPIQSARGRSLMLTEPEPPQGSNCLKVEAYGQRSASGEDLARYGKTLKLVFGMAAPTIGVVEICGGEPGAQWGLALGTQRIEFALPWRDTILAANYVALGSGRFDTLGKAAVPLNLEGLLLKPIGPTSQLTFFMQALSLDAQSQPITSHGLAFTLCGSKDGRDTRDTDADLWSLSNQRYDTHQVMIVQLFQGVDSGAGTTKGWKLSANIRLPDSGWEISHDRTLRQNGETRTLLGIKAPKAANGSGPVIKSITVDLGVDDPGRVFLHIADREQGVPAVYEFVARLR